MSMGHAEVFTHVGDGVRIQAPNGKMVAPVVTGGSSHQTVDSPVSEDVNETGVFGSDDFMHSLFSGRFCNSSRYPAR